MSKAVSRALVVGVVVPAVACLAAVGVELAVMAELPDPVATHWSGSGPDGFSPAWAVPLMTALVAGVLPLVLGASALPALRRGLRGFTLDLLPAVAAGLSVFLGTLLAGSLVMQRGLEDATAAPGVGGVIALGLGAGAVVGVLGWLVQAREPWTRRPAAPAEAIVLEAGQRAAWLGRAEMGRGLVAFLVLVAVALGVTAVAMWVIGDGAAAGVFTGVAALVSLLLMTFTAFTVRVDAAGLTVTSGARLVRMRVPAEDVAQAAAVEVTGLAEYGGYGIRQIPGATAVVLRSGPALEVTRRSGRRFVVTVDDAATAAAVLAASAENAHAAQG
ncbi:DUF1648 domain-containing protein [Demequina iriomotensis]|uniref:DUF1648 domain-containing protein n=1 Tax=Demequina iriomotensis TaxID=1536641 RepID=UPI000783C56F|nr:DUF1648 domain-containing protein [Demequina iriomotensis]